MACLAVFGRGPNNGSPVPHLGLIRADPTILEDIYTLAGIRTNTPVTMGVQNFRLGGRALPEETFVCPDALCRRVLPVYLAQLDHNRPKADLGQNLGQQGALGADKVTWRNFVHRNATVSALYRSHRWDLRVAPNPRGVVGRKRRRLFDDQGSGDRQRAVDRPRPVDFALYYTFIDDTFELVMHIGGGTHWAVTVGRAQVERLHWLIRAGFTLQQTQTPNILDCISEHDNTLKDLQVSPVNYGLNRSPANDLANLQFLCGPCNATKKDGGAPLNLPTFFA